MKSLLVCFDYDGVLADSLSKMVAVTGEAQKMVGAGRPPRRRDFQEIEYLTFTTIARHLGMNEAEAERFTTVGIRLLKDSGDAAFFPGVTEMLNAVASMARVCVVTANVDKVVTAALRAQNIDGVVDRVLGWEIPGDKSDKIRLAMADFGVEAASTFMVGDSVGDIRQGKAAGARTIAVAWGYQSVEALSREQPDAVTNSPAEMAPTLTRLIRS